MMGGRLRASLVIALVVVASAIAGAALDRLMISRSWRHGGPGGPGGPNRSSPERDARRRNDLLDRMTRDLSLTPLQRTSIDSVMQRTDSTLRQLRREMEPRIESVFAQSRTAIEVRLDSTQQVEFAKTARRRRSP